MKMNGIKYATVLLVLLVVIGISFSADRVTIFQDNFENTTRSSSIWTLGSGWSISVIDGMGNSMYSLFDQNSNWDNASVIVDTTGYKNIEVSWEQYKYRSGGWGSTCELKVYANSTQLMDETSPYDILGYRHYYLDSSFDDSKLNLIFSGDTGSSDYIIIDNVKVTGEIIPYKPKILSDGYTTKTSTNSYACVWVKAKGQYADNVSYATATITSPSGKQFTIMLTDTGPCNIKNNLPNDEIYAGEFYVGDEDGNYKLDNIKVYSLTGEVKTKTMNKVMNVVKPKVYYELNLTNNQVSTPIAGYNSTLSICSTYSYDKHFDYYYIDIPNYIYVNGYIYNNTPYYNVISLVNDGHKQFIIKNVTIPSDSCINYSVIYNVDPTYISTIEQANFYYNSLYNLAYNYWNSYLKTSSENTLVQNILSNMQSSINILNQTEYKLVNYPSDISQVDMNSIFTITNRIDNDFNIIFGFYAYHKTNDNITDVKNYIQNIVVPHIDSELQQMNTTINQINQTVNEINNSENISNEKLNEILSNVYTIKTNTVNILSNLTSINQSEEQRYQDIINNINTESNIIINDINDLSSSLGYNQSTETLRSDVLDIQSQLSNLQNNYNQLYQLTQYINQTTTNISNEMDEVVQSVQNSTQTVLQMNNTINSMSNKLDYINETTEDIYSDTQSILTYVNQIESQNNNIISLINGLNQTEKQRYQNIINKINDKSNEITSTIYDLEQQLGYNGSTNTLRDDINILKADTNDIYSLENNLYTLTHNIRTTVNQVNLTVNNIRLNQTYEIDMIKKMFNCSYTATNSICTKLDKLETDILNMNQSNLNSINQVRNDISNINNTLGCNNGTVNKECILLQNINRKIPNLKQVNSTLPTIGQKLSGYGGKITGYFTNIPSIDWGSIIDTIKSTLSSIFTEITNSLGTLL